jgi:hypothetical protein
MVQDVVEIMKESLYDKYVDEHGVVDFGRSGGMSQQKEAKRFLNALNKQSELEEKDCFSVSVCAYCILFSPAFAVNGFVFDKRRIYCLLFRKYAVWQIGFP